MGDGTRAIRIAAIAMGVLIILLTTVILVTIVKRTVTGAPSGTTRDAARSVPGGTQAGGRDGGVAGPDHLRSPSCQSGEWREGVLFSLFACGDLALAVEKAGHGAVVEDLVDRPRQQRRD